LEKLKNVQVLLKKIQNKYQEKLIDIIQQNSQEYLRQLIDEDLKNKVEIAIEEFDNHSLGKKGWLINLNSEGHKIDKLGIGQILVKGLAFIMGVFDTLDLCIPLIIDSPLVTLDQDWRKYLCEVLPSALKGSQTFFLVKHSEYTDEVKDIVKTYIAHEYELDRNSFTHTIIRKLGD
jgi:DNA repair exonuclease SbcCD ATPase subunit